jgi:diacylglycerol kinase (ATP)
MARAHLIVNPIAGAGKTKKLIPEITQKLKSVGLDFDISTTETAGDAVELAAVASRKGYKILISVGGDGTVNEVVNGIYNSGSMKDISLGIISTGTGADYIRTLKIPRFEQDDFERFAHLETRTVDVGFIEFEGKKKIFINFAGIGFDAEIVRKTTRGYKNLGKVSAYLLALFTTLITYKNKEISITIDQRQEKWKIATVINANGRYGGGGMLVAPQADISDGLIDVIVVGDISKPDLLWSLPRIYKGTHLTHPKVKCIKARNIYIDSEAKMSIQADGDIIGQTPATFGIIPSALKIIV